MSGMIDLLPAETYIQYVHILIAIRIHVCAHTYIYTVHVSTYVYVHIYLLPTYNVHE